jgi:uncharacterized protein (TIGR03000 family)
MTRLLRSSAPALVLATIIAQWSHGAARAQYIGGGVGVRPYGVFGGYYPGYLGLFPGGYNGFWSNGFSMYGPPVPTYGVVPGTFGGGDQRLSNFGVPNNIQIYNGAGIGLGASGAGGAGPRRRHFYDAGGAVTGASTPAVGQAMIEVRVPIASAEVLFEGINTRQTGAKRQFQSPLIQVGTTYFYKVQARWKQDGKDVEQTRSVGVRANEMFVVDFTQNEPANDMKPLLGNQ